MAHVWGPGAGEAEVAVPAEGVYWSASVGFYDPGIWGVAYDDAETGVWGGGGAVYWLGECLVGEEDVCFCVEDAEVFVV